MPLGILLANAGGDTSSKADNLVCQIFPFLKNIQFSYVQQLCGGTAKSVTDVTGDAKSIVTFLVSFIFVVIIIFAVYVIIRAAIKYIRSEGDETKIQEAQKAIKSVFIGLVALFIGIIGLVIILVVFNALGAVQNDNPDAIPVLNNTGSGT